MFIVSTIYKTFLDALFPLTKAEQEIFSLSPEQACEKLPPAPSYEGLALPLNNTYSIFAYKDERVAKLIWNIKYKKSANAIKIGGYALYKKLLEMEFGQIPIIIPIPITSKRRRERGFNQCELLVDEIGRLDTNNQFHVEKNLLIRTRNVSRQTLKGRADRLESVKNVFTVDEKIIERFKKAPVIIIDDVITTGSTMYEAMQTLKRAGLENVRGLSLAH